MSSLTGEFPRAIPRAVWLTSRARNAVRRPVFIGAVGVGTAVAALVALILAPREIRREHTTAPALLGARPDTGAFVAAFTQARQRLASADSSLAFARARIASAPAQQVDTLSPILTRQRDSLATAVNDLDALLTRVETAPVSASYRALAESPQLALNSRVKALVDSLSDVERDRDAYGSTGAGDPVYMALSARAADIGHNIQTLAQQRRDELRQQVSKINAPSRQMQLAETPAADTAGWVAERDSAQSLVAQATTALGTARQKALDYDKAVSHAREEAAYNAPPVALLMAALIIGIALGFGTAFMDELRHPRISADEHEVERVTGARVLATVAPRPKNPDRARRMADRVAPRYFDPGADGYQLTYLHVARAGASRLMLTIAAADTGVAAVVAMNVAAIAADEARSTILVDTDTRTSPVAAAMRTHAEPGFADVIKGGTDWLDVTRQAGVGRDRTISLIPSGLSNTALDPARVTEAFRRDAARLARHYEAIVVVCTIEQATAGLPGALPIPDTIICARVGHTRIADVNRAIDGVRAAGGNPLGLVLWDAPAPALPSAEHIARAQRPLHTPVMQELTPTG